ncbi:MAG: fasciclin domain-containing protein [Anaerolineae bacterium]|nr:fasciclin domain-containing protein [Anaerolineae bacterium]
MRRLIWIAVLLLAIGLLALPAVAQEPTLAGVIAERAAADTPEFSALLAALQGADPALLETLNDPGASLTIFAPSDAAFAAVQAAMGDEAFAALLADPAQITDVLRFHIVAGALDYATLNAGAEALSSLPFAQNSSLRITLPTLQGQHVDVLPGFEALTIDRATLTPANADIVASNGVIHLIDAMLQPEATTLGDIVANVGSTANSQFTLMLAALDGAGLLESLADPANDPVTLFLPSDTAFNAALAEMGITADELLADTELLTRIVNTHLVPGRVYAADLGGAAVFDPAPAWLAGFDDDGNALINTLEGATLTFGRGPDGQPQINGGNLFVNDVDGSNGVIFVVDKLLQPPSGE